MVSKLIDHIGFLVYDLETAMERWKKATGYDFRPPSRYTVQDYRDKSDPKPHLSDVRLSMSVQGPPYIELMEPFGSGTHAATWPEGFHHLGFYADDVNNKIADLKAQGLEINGEAIDEEGRHLLFFTDGGEFYGVRLEYNAPNIPHPWFDEKTGERLEE